MTSNEKKAILGNVAVLRTKWEMAQDNLDMRLADLETLGVTDYSSERVSSSVRHTYGVESVLDFETEVKGMYADYLAEWQRVNDAIHRLPGKFQAVLVVRYIKGGSWVPSWGTVAAGLGVSVSYAKALHKKALEMIEL